MWFRESLGQATEKKRAWRAPQRAMPGLRSAIVTVVVVVAVVRIVVLSPLLLAPVALLPQRRWRQYWQRGPQSSQSAFCTEETWSTADAGITLAAEAPTQLRPTRPVVAARAIKVLRTIRSSLFLHGPGSWAWPATDWRPHRGGTLATFEMLVIHAASSNEPAATARYTARSTAGSQSGPSAADRTTATARSSAARTDANPTLIGAIVFHTPCASSGSLISAGDGIGNLGFAGNAPNPTSERPGCSRAVHNGRRRRAFRPQLEGART